MGCSKSLIQILSDSHICAVAIVVLLFWSLDSAFNAVWILLVPAIDFLVTAVAILGIPYISHTHTLVDRMTWTVTMMHFVSAFVSFAAAWILSRFVYGVGPLRCLNKYRSMRTRTHA